MTGTVRKNGRPVLMVEQQRREEVLYWKNIRKEQ